MAKLVVLAFLAVVVVHTTAHSPVCLPQLVVTKNVQVVVRGAHLCPASDSNATGVVSPWEMKLMRYVNERSPRGCRVLDVHLPPAHHCRETGRRNPQNMKTIFLFRASLTCSDPCERHITDKQSALAYKESRDKLSRFLRLRHTNRTADLGLEFEADIALFKGRRSSINQVCRAGDAGDVRSDLQLQFCDCLPRCPPLQRDQLACPAVAPDTVGLCVELCSGDDDCDENQKCCSNGCGHACVDAARVPRYEWFHKCVEPCTDIVSRIRPLIGTYVPQCEDDGSFSRVQIWGSTGYAWCVDRESGRAVSEAFRPGQVPVCPDDDYGSGAPQVQYQAVCPVPSGFGVCVEQCSNDSTCGEGMKCCSNGCGHVCSTPDNVPYFEPPDSCRDSCAYVTSQMGPALPGAYIPQCEEDGSYSPIQTWASPGLSWCVAARYGTPTSGFYPRGQTPDC